MCPADAMLMMQGPKVQEHRTSRKKPEESDKITYQVYQHEPKTVSSAQFKSILLTILQQIPILLRWFDGHQGMEL